MTDLSKLIAANLRRWNEMTIKPDWAASVHIVAQRLALWKSKYVNVSTLTGVPWEVIAVIHERESSQNWNASLAQGDPWNQVSTHVPAGRGPFKSWEAAAVDALMNCAPYAGKWKDWSDGGRLTLLEQYNGLGYYHMGIPSPYIWSGTDQYTKGKYVADGKFDPNAVDKQLGCAALLKELAVPSKPAPQPTPQLKPQPVPAPAPVGFWQMLVNFILSIFKRT